MNKETVSNLLKEVRSLFIYTPDHILHPDHFDHWESHADAVERGEIFRDDCDGFSLTTAELLIRRKANPEDVKIIFCNTETGGGHLVTSWKHWIIDNRQREVRYWGDLHYKWISSMRMSEVSVWRSMA